MGFSSSSLVALTNRWRTYVALAKHNVTFLVVFTTVAGSPSALVACWIGFSCSILFGHAVPAAHMSSKVEL